MANSELNALWVAHQQMPFPAAARGVELKGIDLVLLDSLAAGCISSLVDPAGQPDPEKLSLLAELSKQIQAVTVQLDGEVRHYFAHLGGVAEAAFRTGTHHK